MNDQWASINIAGWLFDFGSPALMVISALLLASLLLTWRACWRRLYPGRSARALLVVVLNLLAFACVFILLTEPQRQQLLQQEVILLTEGADTNTEGLFNGPSVYVSDGIAATTGARRNLKNAHWLTDVAQLPLRQPALSQLHVSGYGLSRSQWQALPADFNISFKPPVISGFTEAHWPRTLVSGETLRIAGHYSHAGTESQPGVNIIELALLDPVGNSVSETRIRNGAHFSLATQPKGTGNLEYTLQARSGDTLLSEQVLSTWVGNADKINIMVQQSAPSFETRQLKNYAAANGAQVLINTQISRDRSISQLANFPEGSEGSEITFSPSSLAAQDVLIMDGRTLLGLATQQRQWLNDAVINGLGLLVLADASLPEAFSQKDNRLLHGFELSLNPNAKTEAVPRLLSSPANPWQQALPVAAMRLQATEADVLIDDHQGNALVINKPLGQGHIAISLISQSHRWLTSGQGHDWSDYWAALIDAVGRPRDSNYLLPQSNSAFFEADERIPVCAMSTADKLAVTIIPVQSAGGAAYEVALAADSLGSPRQCGWYWAQAGGWHQLQLHSQTNGTILDQQGVYIQESGQWLAQKRQQRVNASLERVAGNHADKAGGQTGKWVSEPVNSGWLWLLLVLSASTLWLERKLDFSQGSSE